MKTSLILCVFLVARIHAKFVSPFPKQYDRIVDDCRNETGYTDEVVAEEEKTFYAENKGLRIFNYCFLGKTGFVTSDGKLNIDEGLAKLGPSLFKDIAENCNRREKKYAKTVFSVCFHSGISTYMRLLELRKVIQSLNENFAQNIDVCRNETGYTDEVIAEEEKSNSTRDEGLERFNYCFEEKIGFGNHEQFRMDIVLEFTPQSTVMAITEHCESKLAENVISYTVPSFSACLVQGLSMYMRSASKGVGSFPYGESAYTTKIVDVCSKETGLTKQVPLEEKGVKFSERKGLRKFNDCYLEKNGFVTSDGTLNIDEALAKLPPGFAKPFVEHCQANIILGYIQENVNDFSTCFHQEVQNHLLSFYGFENYWVMLVLGTSFDKTHFTTLFYDKAFDFWLAKRAGFVEF